MDIGSIKDDNVLADLEKSLEMVVERETRFLNRVRQQRATLAVEKEKPAPVEEAVATQR